MTGSRTGCGLSCSREGVARRRILITAGGSVTGRGEGRRKGRPGESSWMRGRYAENPVPTLVESTGQITTTTQKVFSYRRRTIDAMRKTAARK